MIDDPGLTERLKALAGDCARWRTEAKELRSRADADGGALDDALLLAVEETSGGIYAGIRTFEALVADIDSKSHAAAGEIAEVGDAIRLVLMEITELGTYLYSRRSATGVQKADAAADFTAGNMSLT